MAGARDVLRWLGLAADADQLAATYGGGSSLWLWKGIVSTGGVVLSWFVVDRSTWDAAVVVPISLISLGLLLVLGALAANRWRRDRPTTASLGVDPADLAIRQQALIGATRDLSSRWLLDLHALGTHAILNRPIWYGHLARLEQDIETWDATVRRALEHVGARPTEMSRFTNLQNVQLVQFPNAISPEHEMHLRALNGRLLVLRAVAERIAES